MTSYLDRSYFDRVMAEDYPSDPRVPLPEAFANEAGIIQNLLECGGVRNIAVIESEARSIRSNHYHRTDWHFLYVLSGRALYYARPVGAEHVPQPLLFGAGQMFFTPPMVEHVVAFPERTVLMSASRNSRDTGSHEADVVRVKFLERSMLGW